MLDKCESLLTVFRLLHWLHSAYMLFVLIYFPCIAAFAAIKQESGSWKWAHIRSWIHHWIGLACMHLPYYQIGGIVIVMNLNLAMICWSSIGVTTDCSYCNRMPAVHIWIYYTFLSVRQAHREQSAIRVIAAVSLAAPLKAMHRQAKVRRLRRKCRKVRKKNCCG